MLMNPETYVRALELQADAVESPLITVIEASSGSQASEKHPPLIFGTVGNQSPGGREMSSAR